MLWHFLNFFYKIFAKKIVIDINRNGLQQINGNTNEIVPEMKSIVIKIKKEELADMGKLI